MYDMYGKSLTQAEFDEVDLLAKHGGDIHELTKERISGHPDMGIVYESLRDKGLVKDLMYDSEGPVFAMSMTSEGFSYADDWRAVQAASDAERRRDWRHDLRIALVGAVTGLFSGALGGFLYSALMQAAASLPL